MKLAVGGPAEPHCPYPCFEILTTQLLLQLRMGETATLHKIGKKTQLLPLHTLAKPFLPPLFFPQNSYKMSVIPITWAAAKLLGWLVVVAGQPHGTYHFTPTEPFLLSQNQPKMTSTTRECHGLPWGFPGQPRTRTHQNPHPCPCVQVSRVRVIGFHKPAGRNVLLYVKNIIIYIMYYWFPSLSCRIKSNRRAREGFPSSLRRI